MTTLCHFYARGLCKNGASCIFIHSLDASTQDRTRLGIRDALPLGRLPDDAERTKQHPSEATSDPRTSIPCRFATRAGGCLNSSCPFFHEEARSRDKNVGLASNWRTSAGALPDTRPTIPCKFEAYPGGCRNNICPFLHTSSGSEAVVDTNSSLAEEQEVSMISNFLKEQVPTITRTKI